MKKRWSIPVGILILLLVLPLLLSYAGFSIAAPSREDAAQAAWTQLGYPFDEIPRRYPKTTKNEAATRVEEFAEKIGVYEVKTGGARMQPSLTGYFNNEAFLATADIVPPLPEDLKAMISGHEADFDAFYQAFLDGEPPVWDSDVMLYMEAPLPNTILARAVTSAVAADAMHRLSKGDQAGALRACMVIRKLSAAHRARPELISQMIANVLDIQLAQVARKLPEAPPEFVDQLVDPNFRDKFFNSLAMEGWAVSGAVEQSAKSGGIAFGASQQPSLFDRVIGMVARPYFRYCAAENSQAIAETALRIKSQWPGEIVMADVDSETEGKLSSWNALAIAIPSYGGVHKSFGESAMQLEISRMILRGKAARRANQDLFLTPSTVLQSGAWSFTAAIEDGRFTLVFTQPEKLAAIDRLANYHTINWNAPPSAK